MLDEIKLKSDGILVHLATCRQLYRVADSWIHFIAEKFENGQSREIFDSYEKEVLVDYEGETNGQINTELLFNLPHIMMFVTREPK